MSINIASQNPHLTTGDNRNSVYAVSKRDLSTWFLYFLGFGRSVMF